MRRERAAETRERIIHAGAAILHDRAVWNFDTLTVRGVASSGRYVAYGAQAPVDLTWRCRTDYRGFVTDVRVEPAQSNYGQNYGYAPQGYGYAPQGYANAPQPYDYSQYGYRRY